MSGKHRKGFERKGTHCYLVWICYVIMIGSSVCWIMLLREASSRVSKGCWCSTAPSRLLGALRDVRRWTRRCWQSICCCCCSLEEEQSVQFPRLRCLFVCLFVCLLVCLSTGSFLYALCLHPSFFPSCSSSDNRGKTHLTVRQQLFT